MKWMKSLIWIMATVVMIACGAGSAEESRYAVQYFGNDSSLGTVPEDSQRYLPGQLVTIAGNTGQLERQGYRFVGWNTLPDGSGMRYTQGEAATMVEGGLDLHAEWSSKPVYFITYNGNGNTGGSVPLDSTGYEEGGSVRILPCPETLVRKGYSFVGWNTLPDGSGTTYTQGMVLIMGSTSLTLYAAWSRNVTYRIVYDGNENTGGTVPVDQTAYETGEKAVVLDNTGNLERADGLLFSSWNTARDGSGQAFKPGNSLSMEAQDITLYAQWSQGYCVRYDANGGEGILPADSAPRLPGKPVAVATPDVSLALEGYSFRGWNTQANGKGISYQPGDQYIMGNEDSILYAQWNWEGPGALDVSFVPGVWGEEIGNLPYFFVKSLSDGSFLVHGRFDAFYGQSYRGIVRLKADGSIDTSFKVTTPVFPNMFDVNAVVELPDGKLLIGGFFQSLNGKGQGHFARLNADGTTDDTFNSGSEFDWIVYSITTDDSGRYIVAGDFSSYNGVSTTNVVRLNKEGTLDSSFNPGTGANDRVNCVAVTSDGDIMIGGKFTSVNGTARGRIARLNPNGSLDTGFNPGTGFSDSSSSYAEVNEIVVLSDSTLLVSGDYNRFNGSAYQGLIRLNASGSRYSAFDAGMSGSSGSDCRFAVSGSTVLVFGSFDMVHGADHGYLVRLNLTDGSIDETFKTGSGPDDRVHDAAILSTGRALLIGEFAAYNGFARDRMALIKY